jgi:hypothetical protein
MALERLTLNMVDGKKGTAPLEKLPKLQELNFSFRIPQWLPEGLRTSGTLKILRVGGKAYSPDEFWRMLDQLPMEERVDGEKSGAANEGSGL